jgi:Uma2 family endonuclease
MTAAEFLAWDATQTVRHEYVDGELFAMAGNHEHHIAVTLNVAFALREHLRGGRCRVYATEMKLHVRAANAYFYPAVLVCCGPGDAADPLVKREPLLLVEVLSESTSAYDRGRKFTAYRQIPTLREYLLVDIEGRRCDLYRLGGDGLWVLHPSEGEEPVRLESVELTISAAALWAEVPPPEAQSAAPPAA